MMAALAACIGVADLVICSAGWNTVVDSIYAVRNPKRNGAENWISDAAKLFSDAQVQDINTELGRMHERFGIETALVTLHDIKETEAKPFFADLFNYWGVGDKYQNNGLVIGILQRRRKLVMITGKGLSPVLSDAWLNYMQRTAMLKHMKVDSHADALIAGLLQVQARMSAGVYDNKSGSASTGSKHLKVFAGMGLKGQLGQPAQPAQLKQARTAAVVDTRTYTQCYGPFVLGGLVLLFIILGFYATYRCPSCGAAFSVTYTDGRTLRRMTCERDGRKEVHKHCSACCWKETSIVAITACHDWSDEILIDVSSFNGDSIYRKQCLRCSICETRTEHHDTGNNHSSSPNPSSYSGGTSSGDGAELSF
jgi:uncharacterized membrane protein YgcG